MDRDTEDAVRQYRAAEAELWAMDEGRLEDSNAVWLDTAKRSAAALALLDA